MIRHLFLTLLLLLAMPLWAGDRVALVIGNAVYLHTRTLTNPPNDAADIANALRQAGFEVQPLIQNATKAQMDAALSAFAGKAMGADQALVYFAGHGAEADGENYLVPVDAKLLNERTVSLEAVKLSDVMKVVSASRELGLVVLDACRDNPMATKMARMDSTRTATRGFVRVDPRGNLLVAYAAEAGSLASDGAGRNSPFTAAILQALKQQPPMEVRLFWGQVRDAVMTTTNYQQQPFTYGSLGGRPIFLAGSSAVLPRPNPEAPATHGEVRVDVSPAHARVRVDDALVAIARPLRLEAGKSVLIRAEAEGYEAAEERVLVQGGQLTEVPLRLMARQARVTVPQPSPAQPPNYLGAGGSVFRDSLRGGGEGPEMVVIPAGSFQMGSPASEKDREGDEGPQRRVTIRSFAMGTTEVTFADYDRCTAAGVCAQEEDRGWGRGTRPVINVSWNDAQGYARWLSDQTGKRYRLPSEAEWEYAARGGTQSAYWWGDNASHEHANYGTDECCAGLAQGRDQWGFTAPVKSFAANGFGLYEVSGNVWEWVQDCYKDSYAGAPTDGKAVDATNCDERVVRGAAWDTTAAWLRVANRNRTAPVDRIPIMSFRLAEDL